MTNINFGDLMKAAGDVSFEAIPAGTYDAVVDTAASKPTSTGKESIAVQFKLTTGPYAGKSCFWQAVLTPDSPTALSFWFRHMAACGLTEKYFESNPALERVAADLIGRSCRVILSIRQYQGQDRNQVDTVLPPLAGSGPSIPPPTSPAPGTSPTPSVTGSGSLKPPAVPNVPSVPAVPSVAPAPPATPAVTSPPPPPADDDLPF